MQRIRQIFTRILIGLLMLLGLLAVTLRLLYGGGGQFPDRSTPPRLAPESVEVVATLREPPGNIAVSRTGRVFITLHPEAKPEKIKVAEIVGGNVTAYPDETRQSLYHAPQGIRIDRQDRLWTIDHADNGLGQPRLLAIDLNTATVAHQYDFPRDIAPRLSYLQDLVIDPAGQTVYIADVNFFGKSPALIVYDLASKSARRVLEKDPSVIAGDYIIQAHTGPLTKLGGLIAMKPSVDSIGIDDAGEWLYYGAMTHTDLFRIRTADLKNAALTSAELAARVETFAPKIVSDGISVDRAGNVYLTDVEHNGVAVIGQDRKLFTYVRDPRIRWADGLSFGPDGYLYLADSDIPNIVLASKAHIAASAPFYLFRFKPIAPAAPGQ